MRFEWKIKWLGVFSYAASGGFSVLCSWNFLLCGSVWFFNLPLSHVLGFMPTVFFLCGLLPPAQSISILFMPTLCMENVIGRICKLCICTCHGDPGTTGIDPMAFTCHDMVLEVPLERYVVLDVAASLKLKRSPAQSTNMFFMFTLTLCIECMDCGGVRCDGVVVRCCGAVV